METVKLLKGNEFYEGALIKLDEKLFALVFWLCCSKHLPEVVKNIRISILSDLGSL